MLITILLSIFALTAIATQFLRNDLKPLQDPISEYLTPVAPYGWILDAGYVALGVALGMIAQRLTGAISMVLMTTDVAVLVVMVSAVWRSRLSVTSVTQRLWLESAHLASAAIAFLSAAIFMLWHAFQTHNTVLEGLAIALPASALVFYLEWRNRTAVVEKLAITIIITYLLVLMRA